MYEKFFFCVWSNNSVSLHNARTNIYEDFALNINNNIDFKLTINYLLIKVFKLIRTTYYISNYVIFTFLTTIVFLLPFNKKKKL